MPEYEIELNTSYTGLVKDLQAANAGSYFQIDTGTHLYKGKLLGSTCDKTAETARYTILLENMPPVSAEANDRYLNETWRNALNSFFRH